MEGTSPVDTRGLCDEPQSRLKYGFLEAEMDVVEGWIRERESIRIAKEAGLPKPWSRDPLFQNYRWCNVSRMDDLVSRQLMKHWYKDASAENQLVAAVIGRLVNWPDSLLDATGGKAFEVAMLPEIRRALHARVERKQKVFTGAYLIPSEPGRNKVDSILDLVERVRDTASTILSDSLRGTWQGLVSTKGLGSFLAGQMTADMAYLSSGEQWLDRFSWAPVGPGSSRGMNRIRGRNKDKLISQQQFDQELLEFIEVMHPRVKEIAQDRQLGAQDWQSVMCEADKRLRLMSGEGKVRAGYNGRGSEQSTLF